MLFALWSERNSDWTIAHIEIPRPPVNWKPGRKPMKFVMRTPGAVALRANIDAQFFQPVHPVGRPLADHERVERQVAAHVRAVVDEVPQDERLL